MKWQAFQCPRCTDLLAVRSLEASVSHDCPASKKGQNRQTMFVPIAGHVDVAGRITR